MALVDDLRFALRTSRLRPLAALAIIATLGIAIGANTAIFALVYAVLFRPLPYPEPERLAQVVIFFRSESRDGYNPSQNGRAWETVRDHASKLDVAVLGGTSGVNLASGERAEYVRQQRIGAGLFRVLGVAPQAGREFSKEEDTKGGPPAVILSYKLWARLFQRDPAAIGRSLLLRGEPYTVVGVMPEGAQTNASPDLWTPLRPSTTGEGSGTNYTVIARLRPGVNWAEADAELESVGKDVIRSMRLRLGVTARFGIVGLHQERTRSVRQPLIMLWGAVGIVLLIACVNVAGILSARAAGRTQEIAARMALGAGRSAILRQLLTESVVTGALGGLFGLAIGYGALHALKRTAAEAFSVVTRATIDYRVLAVTALIALATSIVCGLLPAIRAGAVDLRSALGGRSIAGPRRLTPMRLLIAGQVALSVALLVGAGLLIRTFLHLSNLDPGFDGSGVITASFSLQDARYRSDAKVNALFDKVLEKLREVPGVEAAAAGLTLPYERPLNLVMRLPGMERPNITDVNYVTPDYFRALRMRLLRGRLFKATDRDGAPRVVVVNDAFVRHYLKGSEPLGITADIEGDQWQIVGIVAGVQAEPGWGQFGPVSPTPTIYIPAAQSPEGLMTMVHTWFAPKWIVRTSRPEGVIQAAIENAARAADPLLPIASFRTLGGVKDRLLAWRRLLATLLGVLGAVAALLAATGIYALVANSVVDRTREFGLRLALGATHAQAVGTAVRPAVALAVAGAAAGLLLAFAAQRMIASQLWGVRPMDPLTLAVAAAAMVVIALAASLIPALRIARLNPAETLRFE